MNVNNINKTLNPYAEKGKKGVKRGNPGRPKGAKDKIARTAKQNIEKVVEKLGGWQGIFEWANKNSKNRALLYGWYFKMLPSNISGDIEANINVNLIKTITDKRPEEG